MSDLTGQVVIQAGVWHAKLDEIERLYARVDELEYVLKEIRQAAEDNNLMPDYIITLTMNAQLEQGESDE